MLDDDFATTGPEGAPELLTQEGPTRMERDSLGEMRIPADVYWGIHTARALVNFPISRRAISNYPDLVDALARVKQASARANRELGVLDPEKADIIDAVCERIVAGELHDQFVVGVIQGGAGTSTNMNVNEVIANAGLEAMGHRFGEYEYLNPIDDVNRSQSTNDVYPTAIKLAMVFGLQRLLEEHRLLTASFAAKGREFAHVLKVGRTQLQDAVPMTLGQEFPGFATTLREDYDRLTEVIKWMNEINMGATAIGTGITADPRFAEAVRCHLEDVTGLTHGDRARPHRGHRRRGHLHDPLGHAEARRGEALQDLQRPAPAVVRARRRASARSRCRRARPGRASCRARSTRSSPRS